MHMYIRFEIPKIKSTIHVVIDIRLYPKDFLIIKLYIITHI